LGHSFLGPKFQIPATTQIAYLLKADMVPVDEHTRLVTSSVWAILSGGTYKWAMLLPLAPSTFIKTPGWMDGWDGMVTFPYESELDFKVLIKAFFLIKKKI